MTRAKDSQLIIASALKLSVPIFIKPIYEKKYELGNRKFIELCHPLWEDHSSGEKVQTKYSGFSYSFSYCLKYALG